LKKEFKKKCLNKTHAHLKPFIPRAIECAEKIYDLKYTNANVAMVIQLAGEFYEILKQVDKPSDLELLLKFNPETAIMSDILLSEILPIVEEIRLRLFGEKSPPFPNNIEKATKWIQDESRKIPETMVKKPQLTYPEFLKLMTKTIPSYVMRKDQLLPGHRISYKIERLTISHRDVNGKQKNIQIFEGTKPFFLSENSRLLAQKTDFPQDSLITFILTGIRPYLPSIRIRTGMRRFGHVQIDFYRGMDYEEFLFLHRKLKSLFKRKKTLNEKHFEVYRLVSKKGGIPRKGKSEFWEKLLKDWNKSHPNDKYGSPNNLRITYNRILKSVTIPQSSSSES